MSNLRHAFYWIGVGFLFGAGVVLGFVVGMDLAHHAGIHLIGLK